MKVKIAIVTMFGLVALGAFSAANVKVQAQQKTQWDGVYTEDQAKRGEPLYAEKCSSCHGPDMNGGEMAPGLTGGEFQANWNDLQASLGTPTPYADPSLPGALTALDGTLYVTANGAIYTAKVEVNGAPATQQVAVAAQLLARWLTL